MRATFVLTAFLVAVPATRADTPNVLMVVVDDLNDWVGCLGGHPQAKTPNIDALAARGMLFTNAHCTSPACNPSRAAVFTGRREKTTGMWSNTSGQLEKKAPDLPLLTESFRDAGYATLGAGKLLHNSSDRAVEEYYGLDQRWSPLGKAAVQYTDEELPSKGTATPRHVTKDPLGREVVLPLNGLASDRNPTRKDGESFDWGGFDLPDETFAETQVTNWASGQLATERDRPTFLAVGYYRPHIPLWPPQRFLDRFENQTVRLPRYRPDDLDDLSPLGREWAIDPIMAGYHSSVAASGQWPDAVAAYLACVTYVDHEIGRLLASLDASPMAENTWVVLWSDHGWHLGEKQHWGKWTGWEPSTRVPLIIVPQKSSAGDYAAAGSRCDQPVSLIDLYPTLTEACGVRAPEDLAGQSLLPLLKNPSAETGRVVITTFDEGNVSARGDRFRYLRYVDGSEELYDLKADPEEWANLIGEPTSVETIQRFRDAVAADAGASGG